MASRLRGAPAPPPRRILLPVTAVATIYGMNVIVNSTTDVEQLVFALVTMAVVSLSTLLWARRQGWG